jgi:zinc protease
LVGIAGNYSGEFFNMFKEDLAKLPDTKPDIPTPPKVDLPKGINVEIISKDGAFGSAIFTGFPIDITRAKDDFAALMVANSYLGEHRKSYGQLYQKIREQRSMNYGDYSYIEWYENGGGYMLPPPGVPRHSNYFALWIRPVQIANQLQQQYEELKDVEVGHALFALRMAVREVDKLISEGMSKEDFEATRDFLRSYIKLYISTPADQLGYLMDSKFYGRENYIKEMDKLLAKVTLEDVNNTVKKYLQVENMYIAIVTDKSEAGPLAEALRTNAPSPMSYSNLVKENLPEEILAEDAKVAGYKLNVNSVEIVTSEEMFK